MRYTFLPFTLVFSMISAPAIAQSVRWMPEMNLPGKLDAFLTTTKNATVRKQPLGSFAGGGTATFTALIASDPANPAAKVKGLEVRLRDQQQEATVYLDQDSLKSFQEALASLLDVQRFVAEHLEEYDSTELTKPNWVPAVNQVVGPAKQKAERAMVLFAGWYFKEKETSFGVVLGCFAAPGRESSRGHGTFHFPNATLDNLIEIIASSREFLKAN